jgi:hypothetical protein
MQLQFKETRYITKQFLTGQKVQNDPITSSLPVPATLDVARNFSTAPRESPRHPALATRAEIDQLIASSSSRYQKK